VTIREGKWKCPGCGEVNRGARSQCDHCGATRDASVKFFLDEDAPEVSEQEEVKKATAGADWLCEFCGNASPSAATACSGCGAPRSSKEKKHGEVIPVVHGTREPSTGYPVEGLAGGPPRAAAPVSLAPVAGCAVAPMVIGAVALLLLLLCCVSSLFVFRTQSETATVASVAWERTVAVEDFLPTEETAWDGAPAGARNVTHRQEQRSTRQVQVGTHTDYRDEQVQTGTKKIVTGHKDLGNGFFEDVTKDVPIYETRKVPHEVATYRDEPVYGERYSYTIDRWREVRTERAKGSAEKPHWPATGLKGKQREGARTESYLVTFTGSKVATKTMKAASEDVWSKLVPGSTWKAEFSNAGHYTVLDASGAALPLDATDERIE